MDKSLKSYGELSRHRNVLSRTERIEALQEEERWQDGQSVLGLPKVGHRKVVTRKKKEVEKVAEAATSEGGDTTEASKETAS